MVIPRRMKEKILMVISSASSGSCFTDIRAFDDLRVDFFVSKVSMDIVYYKYGI